MKMFIILVLVLGLIFVLLDKFVIFYLNRFGPISFIVFALFTGSYLLHITRNRKK